MNGNISPTQQKRIAKIRNPHYKLGENKEHALYIAPKGMQRRVKERQEEPRSPAYNVPISADNFKLG